MNDEEQPRGTTRRGLFTAVGTAAAAGVAGWALGRTTAPGVPDAVSIPSPEASATPSALPAAHRRAGITFPAVPQRHTTASVFSAEGVASAVLVERVRDLLNRLPKQPDDAGDVTVTVGFAPPRARELWPERAALSAELPSFTGDAAEMVSGGDLAVQVAAETASAVHDTVDAVRDALGDVGMLWSQAGSRDAVASADTARTAVGFIDGIANPRTVEELDAGVWSDAEHRDTHWVLRRMRISPDFGQMPFAAQERAVGRRRESGAPLSGGDPHDNVDLFAKKPDGTPLIAADAHARRAHPSHIGRALMLRRSYSVSLASGLGLLFSAFLSDPETFVATQRRLDEMDALMAHTSTDASGMFFVPGEL